jgi:predicted transcriptional regulator
MQQCEYCTYSIRMPITLRRQIDQLAAAQECRPSQVVRRLIRLAYAEWKREAPQREDACHGSTQTLGV